MPVMRTRDLALHVSAYSDRNWSVSIVEVIYERGQVKGRRFISAEHTDTPGLYRAVGQALRMIESAELARLEAAAAQVDANPSPEQRQLPL
jgi:hypothetical protein